MRAWRLVAAFRTAGRLDLVISSQSFGNLFHGKCRIRPKPEIWRTLTTPWQQTTRPSWSSRFIKAASFSK
jgi:hypothetical protein